MDFKLDDSSPRRKAQQTLAAALQVQQTVGPVVDDDVQAVIDAAETLDKPFPFLIAVALLRRDSLEEMQRFLPEIVDLAKTQSTNPLHFDDPEIQKALIMAIRGSEPGVEPRSWWTARPPGDSSFGPVEKAPPRKVDVEGFDKWLVNEGKWTKDWGIPKSRFSSSL